MPKSEMPLILVTPSRHARGVEFADDSLNVSERYGRAVLAAGGLPGVAPCEADTGWVAAGVARCDGVLLTGGDDLQPELYATGLAPALRATVQGADAVRDHSELAVIREVFRQRKPLFAICRGHQLLNVALGGTLFVDLPAQRPGPINHRQMTRKNEPVHEVTLTPDSLLASITGKETLGVNSTHHQAVDSIAGPLCVAATSADGVVEALELKPAGRDVVPFLLSVQFHPERMTDRYPVFRKLFRAFVAACRRQR